MSGAARILCGAGLFFIGFGVFGGLAAGTDPLRASGIFFAGYCAVWGIQLAQSGLIRRHEESKR